MLRRADDTMRDCVSLSVGEGVYDPTQRAALVGSGEGGDILEQNYARALPQDIIDSSHHQIAAAFAIFPAFLQSQKRVRLAWETCTDDIGTRCHRGAAIAN